jgi:galactose mutarotase-like enzyme
MTRAELASTDGFETYVLRSDAVEVRVVPTLGAKIGGLRDLRTGREWLCPASDGRGLRASRPGDSFDSGPVAGIDECVPTVSPCRFAGRDLPDHGEAWARVWTVDAVAWAQGRLGTTLDLDCLPLRIERELVLEGASLTLSYRLTNLSSTPQPDFWALHPLFAWREGDRIELPPDIVSARLAALRGLDLPRGEVVAWPSPCAGLDLSALNVPTGKPWYAKLFFDAPRDGHVAIVNARGGGRLSIQFDPVQNPHLALWVTRGGWNGIEHVALEPTTHASDTPPAEGHPRARWLAPHASREWGVRIALDT